MKLIDQTNIWLAGMVRWLTFAMVATTLAVVVLRYVFEVSAIPAQEAVMYMHGLVFLLGIPYGILRDTHVRVDLLYGRMSQSQRLLVNTLGHCIFLLPIATFIFWTSVPYVAAAWRVFEGSSEVGGLPAIFLLKTLIPMMAVLLFLQGLSEIARNIFTLRERHDADQHSQSGT